MKTKQTKKTVTKSNSVKYVSRLSRKQAAVIGGYIEKLSDVTSFSKLYVNLTSEKVKEKMLYILWNNYTCTGFKKFLPSQAKKKIDLLKKLVASVINNDGEALTTLQEFFTLDNKDFLDYKEIEMLENFKTSHLLPKNMSLSEVKALYEQEQEQIQASKPMYAIPDYIDGCPF